MKEHIWIDWLNRRGITNSVIEDFGLSFGSHYLMGDAITIPVCNQDGSFSFNKYRRDPQQGDVTPKYLYDKGSRSTVFGLDKIKDSTSVLITEGELDTLVSWSKNIPAVSSTGGAGTFPPDWVEYFTNKEVTVCYDNDSAGGAGMVRVLDIIPNAYVLFLPDRPGVKDMSDYVAGGGDLAELLRGRVHFSSLQEVIDDRALRLSLWQSTFFHDAYIEANSVPAYVRTERRESKDDSEIEAAKTYPISDLLKFDKNHKALCIWHNEKTPSLHYFKNTNTVYCFGGCGKRADAIDVYRQINGASFTEAIKALV